MELRLDLWVLDVLRERLKLPFTIPPFQIPYGPHSGATHDERADYLVEGMRWLRSKGLATDRGLEPDVESLITTWAKPDVLLTTSAYELGSKQLYNYRSGWSGEDAFHSYVDGDAIVIQDGRPEQVPYALLDMFPSMQAFPANPVVIHAPATPPSSDDDGEVSIYDDSDAMPGGQKVVEGNLRVYTDAGKQGGIRGGKISLSTVQRPGKAPELLETLIFADTEQGRYIITTETTSDGLLRLTYKPTDGDLIRWWIVDRLGLN